VLAVNILTVHCCYYNLLALFFCELFCFIFSLHYFSFFMMWFVFFFSISIHFEFCFFVFFPMIHDIWCRHNASLILIFNQFFDSLISNDFFNDFYLQHNIFLRGNVLIFFFIFQCILNNYKCVKCDCLVLGLTFFSLKLP